MTGPTSRAAFPVACLGIAIFSAMDAAMKALTLESGVYLATLWRTATALVAGGLLHLARRPARPRPGAMRLHVERGAIVTAMALLFFWGLARVPMAQAIALCFIAPLLAILLAAALLGEQVGRETWAASAVACLGVGVILAGQQQARLGPDALRGALAILAAAFCYAYNLILMRRQGALSDPLEVAVYQNLVTAGLLALAAPWLGAWPAAHQLPWVAAAALFATVSILLLAWAYGHSEAARLAPSEYTGLIWSSIFGFLVFGEAVRPATIAGAALIAVACLVAARVRRSAAQPVETAL